MTIHKKWLAMAVFLVATLLTSSAFAMSTLITGAHNVAIKAVSDLTTNNTTDVYTPEDEMNRISLAPNDFTADGKPIRPYWYTPHQAVPGYQITGYYEDAKFVIRVPEKWNGKLVVGGMPGHRDEKAGDTTFSDFVLTKYNEKGESYAYASVDKGTRGEVIFDWAAGQKKFVLPPIVNANLNVYAHPPKENDPFANDSVLEWNIRFRQVTQGAREALQKIKGKVPARTYIMGHSNGGYVIRWALEHNSDNLFDGGIDWEGMFWRAEENNMLANLTDMVNAHLVYTDKKSTEEQKQQAFKIITKYVPAEAEFIWNTPQSKPIPQYYRVVYWMGTLDIFRYHFDPEFAPKQPWSTLSFVPKIYKDYDYYKRPQEVKDRIKLIQNSGEISRPLISIFGTLDCLTPVASAAKPYEELVKKANKDDLYRLYIVEKGNHLDGWVQNPLYDKNKVLQPLLPYVHQAFDMLVDWVENGNKPPQSRNVPVPETASKVIDLRNGDEIDPY